VGKAGFLENRILDKESGLTNGELAHQNQPHQPPKCPECASERVWRDGLRYAKTETEQLPIQRFLCRTCGIRFSETTQKRVVEQDVLGQLNGSIDSMNKLTEPLVGNRNPALKKTLNKPSLSSGEDVCSQVESHIPTVGKDLYAFHSNSRNRQVCVSDNEMKNLSQQRARQKQAAGATKKTNIKGKLIEFIWHMKKQGYAESTVKSRAKLVKRLVKLAANLYDPEDVKKVIAEQSWCPGRKSNVCDAYATFLKMIGGSWDKPFYKSIPQLPFIPQESEIDQLIAACSPRMASFLQLLKETGMRPGEGWQLKWTDIDTVTRTLRVTPKKGSNPRIFHISIKLTAMLETSPRDYGDRIFSRAAMHLKHHRDHFRLQRKRVAHKLKNPRILRITFKTFRHWKGTMEYHRTKDILHVKQILGHVNIQNTLRYVTLAKELFKGQLDYISKVSHNVKESCTLVNAGFEYVTGEYSDGGKIFRKPKYLS